MEKYFRCQLDRVDRLMKIILSENQTSHLGDTLEFEDIIIMTCQSMWHLKDWVLKDDNFGAKDISDLSSDIHKNECLLVCADLANGSKHFVLDRPHVGQLGAQISDIRGISVSSGVYKIFYYIDCGGVDHKFHGYEIRDFLSAARQEWESIIDKHFASKFMPL